MTETIDAPPVRPEISPQKLRQVVIASAAGTVFEWYDFFIYGALATLVSRHFFANLPDAQAFVFTLFAFAAGFLVRPLGALVFGKIGDSRGRKGAFLITISMMGLATFAIGLLPDYAQIGPAAPILLIGLRVVQGFALGGEYGGAAIYVAEHAPEGQRGLQTSWIQTSAAIGLVGALGVIWGLRTGLGEEAFSAWGWRLPFLISLGLLAISLWIRVRLEESPVFQAMEAEGRASKKAMAETFLAWPNLRLVLIALFGIMMAQGVVWYTGHFYAQFFLERVLKLAPLTVNLLMISVVTLSAAFYVLFGWLSDKIGRKPVMLGGMALMLVLYFPGFHALTRAANPALAAAQASAPVRIAADPSDCSFLLDLTGGARQFATSCDIARTALADAGISYRMVPSISGQAALILVRDSQLYAPSAENQPPSRVKAIRADFAKQLAPVLQRAGYPLRADPARVDFAQTLLILFGFILAATALYGPIAATLVELFPARIRYTALSVPYHIGTGVFGGMLPLIVFAIVTANGDIYSGLWFPTITTGLALLITLAFMPETNGRRVD